MPRNDDSYWDSEKGERVYLHPNSYWDSEKGEVVNNDPTPQYIINEREREFDKGKRKLKDKKKEEDEKKKVEWGDVDAKWERKKSISEPLKILQHPKNAIKFCEKVKKILFFPVEMWDRISQKPRT